MSRLNISHNWIMSQGSDKILRSIIANNVKIERNKQKMSREKLSLLIGMDNSYISKLERCKMNATIDILEKIAEVLKINVLEIFKSDNE